MHKRTLDTLDGLRNADWFINVGVQDTTVAAVLSSWGEAIESCSSPAWEELCMEAASQYRERVYERSPNDFDKWNEVVAEVKPYVKQLVSEKISEIIRANSLPKIFLDTVEWDILHLCMESEFAEVYPPGFYASQAYWYAKGHFPCGWQGSFPRSGKLLIY